MKHYLVLEVDPVDAEEIATLANACQERVGRREVSIDFGGDAGVIETTLIAVMSRVD